MLYEVITNLRLPGENMFSDLPYIACPHGQEDISRPKPGRGVRRRLPGRTGEEHRLVPVLPDRFRETLPRGVGDRLLPRGVDLEQVV